MRRLGMIAILAFLVVGCGRNKYPKPYVHNTSIVRSPDIGKMNTVEIGQTMFTKGYTFGKTISVVGGYVQTKNSTKKYKFTNNKLRITKEGHNALCYSWFCSADTTNDGFMDSWWDVKDDKHYLPLKEKTPYIVKDIYKETSFKYESLFQGKVGNKLKISFREFSGGLARPAFTQDIEYELSPNGTAMIGFKGLRIKVLEATNFNIKYKVIKDYD